MCVCENGGRLKDIPSYCRVEADAEIYFQYAEQRTGCIFFWRNSIQNGARLMRALKGVFAKNERGYRLNAIKKRF